MIKQPYYQDPKSGGFLLVSLQPAQDDAPATLTFEHFDEHGKPLYQEIKK